MCGEVDRALIVEGLVDRKPSRIGMVSPKIAARRGLERERHGRTVGSVTIDGREYPGLEAAGDCRCVCWIDETLCDQTIDDLGLDRISNVSPVPDAGIGG